MNDTISPNFENCGRYALRTKTRCAVSFTAVVALALTSACGGGGYSGGGTSNPPPPTPTTTLGQAGAHHNIKVGAAAFSPNFIGDASYGAVLGAEFSQLEPENEMKFSF